MLRYKIKLNEPKHYNEIACDELYLSPDLSFISGITDPSYELVDGQNLKIEFNDDERFHDVIVKIKNVTRQGYVTLNQSFSVKLYKDYLGFRYVNGKYYFCEKDKSKITVLGKSYDIVNDRITIPTKYWVEDFKLKIGDIEYDVDIQLEMNENGEYVIINQPFVEIKGGQRLSISECNQSNWKKVTKFYIKKNDDFIIKLDYVSCAKKYPYFVYAKDQSTDYSDKGKVMNYGNTKYYLTFNTNTSNYEATTDDGKTFIQDYTTVKCGDEKYKLEYEWRNTSSGKNIHLFVDNAQYKFVSSQKILAETPSVIETKCDVKDDNHIIYCGKKYMLSDENDTVDFVEIDGNEYKLTYIKNEFYKYDNGDTSDVNGYIMFNNMPLGLKVNDTSATRVTTAAKKTDKDILTYTIKKYRYVEIDNEKFLMKTYKRLADGGNKEIGDINFITVIKKQKFILSVDEVINNNMLRCHAIVNEDGDDSGICNIIASNYKNFVLKLFNPLFEEYNISEDSFILSTIKLETDVFDSIRIFNPSNYIKIPFVVSNEFAANIGQEDMLENIFFEQEKQKSINPYVDMEREIFYPTRISDDGKELSLINEITFDLHFRSRNLDDWKINEDVFTNMKKESKDVLKTKYDWNIFDNYQDYNPDHIDCLDENSKRPTIDSTILSKEEFKYYQPADLLYFLKFTDNDIFYQKSKVGKSFLRLLFFDSVDVANQTLLYSCTVWMNENKLYKTYIDNIYNKENMYVSVSETVNEDGFLTSSAISVYNDTCNVRNEVTFEEDKRLAAKFTIKNRYESEESAEGFYLYIFKDYCEKLHEKTIYMKVEFNHAGEGRTVNFVMPMKYDDEYNAKLMDLSPGSSDLGEFKKGYGLRELYEHLFIPINIIYDDKNNRYSYYLPEGLVEHDEKGIMKFNLYELKIKDESDESNT